MYLLEMGQPAEAAKLVSDDLDEATRTYVPLAAKPIREIAEAVCAELGDWYRQLAEGATGPARVSALRRAKAYYNRFSALHTKEDTIALRVKMGLKQVDEALKIADPPPYVREILIEARIDGDTELWVTSKGIFWKNGRWIKPGPIWVNGKSCVPEWGRPGEKRIPDTSKVYPMRIGKLDFRLRLLAVGETRKAEGIETRSPIRLRRQRANLIVSIPDEEPGARWYRFRLSRAGQ